MSRGRAIRCVLLAGLASIAASAGVSSGAPSPSSRSNAGSADPLIQAAKAEKEVVYYASLTPDEAQVILPTFEKKYGIKVTAVLAPSAQLLPRLIAELKAGHNTADVVDATPFDVYPLIEGGKLAHYNPPARAAYPRSRKDKAGIWTVTRLSINTISGWNTNLVSQQDAPKKYSDFLNPKWKGKIVIAQDDSDTFTVLGQNFLGGFTKASRWLRGLAANDPQIIQGATQVTELVAAGQDAITLNARTMRFLSLKKQGAPVAWNLTKAVAQPAIISVLRSAPHPAAARLFERWLLSTQGQTLMAAAGRVPGLPSIKYDHRLLAHGTKVVVVKPYMVKQYARYQKEWNTVLGIK